MRDAVPDRGLQGLETRGDAEARERTLERRARAGTGRQIDARRLPEPVEQAPATRRRRAGADRARSARRRDARARPRDGAAQAGTRRRDRAPARDTRSARGRSGSSARGVHTRAPSSITAWFHSPGLVAGTSSAAQRHSSRAPRGSRMPASSAWIRDSTRARRCRRARATAGRSRSRAPPPRCSDRRREAPESARIVRDSSGVIADHQTRGARGDDGRAGSNRARTSTPAHPPARARASAAMSGNRSRNL
mgnify:CR=1 FL=1